MLQYLKLLKLKQTFMLVFSGFTSMIIAAGKIPPLNMLLLFLSSLALVVAGSTAVNMYFDRDIDGIMRRTRDRPLPQGSIDPPWKAVALGLVLFLAGLSISNKLNYMVAAIFSFGFVFYILAYTLTTKRKTPWSVIFGGIAGAAPSLAGWTASTGSFGLGGVLTAMLILLWIPEHIWTLSSYYVDDYTSAGVPMLPVVWGIKKSALATLFFSLGTSAVTIALGYALRLGLVYFIICFAAIIAFIRSTIKFYLNPSPDSAFKAFKTVNISLSVILMALVLITVF